MSWLSFLFCRHEWEVKEEHNTRVFETWDGEPITKNPSWYEKLIILRCKKCGDIKAKRIKY